MKQAIALWLAAVWLASAAPAAPAPPSYAKLNARVVDGYAIPRFKRFETASGRLAQDLRRLCADEKGALTAVRTSFADAVLAWAEIEFLRFGPMSVVGRPERIVFAPDPRNVTQRQVNALVAKRDAAALDPAALAKKSAAVQGLSAIEVLLFDDGRPLAGDGDEARYRCRLALAMAETTHARAREALGDWEGEDGWRRRILQPGAQDAVYKLPEEPAADFARALITGLQMIQDREVVPMIEAVAAPQKVPRLPFSRSGLSARYIAAGIASAEALYKAMGLARSVPGDKAWMTRWIGAAFERLAQDAPDAVKGIPDAKDNPDRARQLRMVRFHVEGIRKLVGREIAPLAGLTIGFNELDGD